MASDRPDLSGGASLLCDDCDTFDVVDEDETVRMGENEDMAEPGLAGRVLLAAKAAFAFFCASIVSLSEGFGGPVVLLEKPKPGRTAAGSGFLGELGLSGEFSRSLCWVASRVDRMLGGSQLEYSERIQSIYSRFCLYRPY